MGEIWLTIERVRELTGWSERHARRAAEKSGWQTRMSESRGTNGKHEREYLLGSLPAEAQLKYAAGAAQDTAIVKRETSLPLFAEIADARPEPRRSIVPADGAEIVEMRYKAIEPLLDFRRRTNGHRPTIALADGRKVSTLADLAEYIAGQQKPAISSGTVWRWLRVFLQGGYAALADPPRKDCGKSRFFDGRALAAAYLQTKFLAEGLSQQMCWEALRREWKRIGETGAPPSYNTARRYLNSLAKPLTTLARDGAKVYEGACSPYILRGKAPCAAMDWWVLDHREFDVLVVNTMFDTLPAGQAFRPSFTAAYDWGSRKLVGFCLAPTPSSRTINSALRMAILSHAFPRNFYWDNGKDFRKVRGDIELVTLSAEAKSLFDGQGIGVTSALPFHPRSKPIESWFSRWSKRFDVLWGKAYVGNRPGNCPEVARAAQKMHEAFRKGKRRSTPLPADFEFIAATMQWIEEYNATPLKALDLRTPNEVMEEQWPERNRPAVDPRMLDVLFAERKERVVQAGGCVQLDRMRYEPTDASLCAMDLRQGRQVMILRDPYNLGEAVAADPETFQVIGELRIQQFVAQCPNGQITRDQIQAAMRRQRGLKRGYAEYCAALAAMAANFGWQTELEGLLGRAGMRTGTDNRLLAGTPGALRGPAPALGPGGPAPRMKPRAAFVSDTIAADADVFAEVALEDGDAAADD